MLNNQPHPLISVLVIFVAVLIAYPLATRMTDALRPLMEDFLDRRDAEKLTGPDFESEHHLLFTPAKGTPVVLAKTDNFLLSMGVDVGHQGTVVMPTRLNPDDAGVLVNWGSSDEDVVRMNLNEIRLAPAARAESARSRPHGSREYRSALTLKPFDTITIPGLGTKLIGAIHQTDPYEYQLRLDKKFVESVTVTVAIGNGDQRSPERRDCPWRRAESIPGTEASSAETPPQSPEQTFSEMEENAHRFLRAKTGKPSPTPPPGYEFPGDARP